MPKAIIHFTDIGPGRKLLALLYSQSVIIIVLFALSITHSIKCPAGLAPSVTTWSVCHHL